MVQQWVETEILLHAVILGPNPFLIGGSSIPSDLKSFPPC